VARALLPASRVAVKEFSPQRQPWVGK